jgi:tetratricopeptide (TPR) repeat protein
LLARGHAGKAVAEALEAKHLAPRSAAVREVLGIALYRSERFREALSEIQAYRRMSGRADQNHIAADCQRALGQPEKAVRLAAEALEAPGLPPDARAEAAIVGASALADQGRTEEALAFLRRFRTRADVGRPFDLRVWYVAGDILARAGRTDEAAEQFRRVVRFDADAFDAAERLAQLR